MLLNYHKHRFTFEFATRKMCIHYVLLELLLLILLQQLADEFLGQLTGVTEELLIKLVIYGWNVPQRVLFGFPQERRSPTQPAAKHKKKSGSWSRLREAAVWCKVYDKWQSVHWASLAGCRWWPQCSTCLLLIPAAHSWRSPVLKRQTDKRQIFVKVAETSPVQFAPVTSGRPAVRTVVWRCMMSVGLRGWRGFQTVLFP